jgi:hypothetical protein
MCPARRGLILPGFPSVMPGHAWIRAAFFFNRNFFDLTIADY